MNGETRLSAKDRLYRAAANGKMSYTDWFWNSDVRDFSRPKSELEVTIHEEGFQKSYCTVSWKNVPKASLGRRLNTISKG